MSVLFSAVKCQRKSLLNIRSPLSSSSSMKLDDSKICLDVHCIWPSCLLVFLLDAEVQVQACHCIPAESWTLSQHSCLGNSPQPPPLQLQHCSLSPNGCWRRTADERMKKRSEGLNQQEECGRFMILLTAVVLCEDPGPSDGYDVIHIKCLINNDLNRLIWWNKSGQRS